jgi:hypothetical protein
MIIDATTHSKVYNTVGPQAQWFAHRWGRRDYPDLHLDPSQIPDNDVYHLACFYGDTAEWKHLDDFLCTTDATVFIDTYGMFSTSTVELLQQSRIGFIKIHVDGWDRTMGKVHLNQDIQKVKHTMYMLSDKVQMEYYLYEHNMCDVPAFEQFCKDNDVQYNIQSGALNDDGMSCIVDENAEWLYDIFPASETLKSDHEPALYKSTLGSERLKTYLREPDGRGILNKPMLPNMSTVTVPQSIKKKFQSGGEFVAVTGHAFDSVELGQMFSMLLCSDWKFNALDLKNIDDYRLSILYAASVLTKDLRL